MSDGQLCLCQSSVVVGSRYSYWEQSRYTEYISVGNGLLDGHGCKIIKSQVLDRKVL